MFEIFGSVFGRGKKSTSSLKSSSNLSQRSNSVNELNQSNSSVLYPTILTDELIRSPARASFATSLATGPLIEASDELTTISPLPTTSSETSSMFNLPYTSHGISLQSVQVNPLDNVPFIPSSSATSSLTGHSNYYNDSMKKVYQSLDRISLFLSTPSISEYNFSLERSVTLEPSTSSPTSWLSNGNK